MEQPKIAPNFLEKKNDEALSPPFIHLHDITIKSTPTIMCDGGKRPCR